MIIAVWRHLGGLRHVVVGGRIACTDGTVGTGPDDTGSAQTCEECYEWVTSVLRGMFPR